jgi:intracellular septation protein
MIKFITELAPLLAFFIGYKQADMQTATIYMVIASVLGLAIYFAIYRKLEKVTLISSGILLVTALITIATDNLTFIKMKPTILYSIFAGVLLFGIFNKRPILKYLLGTAIQLKDDATWYILSYRFVWFFAVLAIANEIIWRFYSDEIWVNFKVFCILPITLIFILSQMPFLYKNKI